jgi:predicted transcriptional regulator
MFRRQICESIVLTVQIPSPQKIADESKFWKMKQGNSWLNNKGAKRSRMEIIAEILLLCHKQKAKTSIMYKINLNYAQLKTHLAFLTAQDMLLFSTGKYTTTEKGYRFLELFLGLQDFLTEEKV